MNNKVLFICPTSSLSAGGEVSNYQLVKYLKTKGCDVYVITPHKGEYNRELTKSGIKNTSCNYTWWQDVDATKTIMGANIPATASIVEIIKAYKPDVVITNTLNIPWGALAAALTNKPHIWIAREFPVGEFRYLKEKLNFIRTYSNVVMANSQQLARTLKEQYAVPAHSFYSFVDASKLSLGKDSQEIRLVSINRISERKNQLELINALMILKKRRPTLNLKVLLVGDKDGAYWKKIESNIHRGGLEDSIEYHSFARQPWRLVTDHDILVQTSLSESIGRTTTEAMKLGVPVIASDIPGHVEAFSLGGGTLYKSQDQNDLADKIEYAVNNIAQLKKRAEYIRKTVLKKMSEEACNSSFVKELGRCLKQQNPQLELGHIRPYLFAYISETKKVLNSKDQLIKKIEHDLNEATKEIIALRNSKAYKLGRTQADMAKKMLHINTKTRKEA